MQRTAVTALLTILLLTALSLDAFAMQAERCDPGLESLLRWRVTSPKAAAGSSSIQTSMAVVEIAHAELDLMPVLWFQTVQSASDGAAFDLRDASPVRDQVRFLRTFPATNVAIGRMVPGACFSEVYEAIQSAKTAVFLGGPRFATAEGGSAQARQQVFSTSIAGFRPDQDDAYPQNGARDSRISLQTRQRPETTVQLRIEALIKRDATAASDVVLRAAVSIESHGILVMAKRAEPARIAAGSQQLVQIQPEKVVLLFVLPRS